MHTYSTTCSPKNSPTNSLTHPATRHYWRLIWQQMLIITSLLLSPASYANSTSAPLPRLAITQLTPQLKVGDIVFITVPAYPFKQISLVTQSWTNHVGIIVQAGKEPIVAESAVPFSRRTPLSRFVARSEQGRLAVLRLNHDWSEPELEKLQQASEQRMGILYDTGFNLHSQRQFCSRFVREVIQDAIGISLGEVVNFDTLLKRNPEANLDYWRAWYFGKIPWTRQTVTPASLYQENNMSSVFDGYILPG